MLFRPRLFSASFFAVALTAGVGSFYSLERNAFAADGEDGKVAVADEKVAAKTAADVAAANAASEARLLDSVRYLASDELEGRGVGTNGLDAASYYLAAEFARMGLKTDLIDGLPFQKFKISLRTKLGPNEKNRLAFVGPADAAGKPQRFDLELNKAYTTLAIGGSATFDLPLVFAGYGITAPQEGYDDYAGIDVKDKAVIVLRHNPQYDQKGGPFTTGHGPSRHASFDQKVSNAYQHGAGLVILVNDEAEIRNQTDGHQKRWREAVDKLADAHAKFKSVQNPSREDTEKHREETAKLADDVRKYADRWRNETDPLVEFERAGSDNGGRPMPVVFATRAAVDRILKAAIGKDLATIEVEIDIGGAAVTSAPAADAKTAEPAKEQPHAKPTPKSVALGAWKATGQTAVIREQAAVKNVLAVLEGEGPLADETIVIGAHYDHLGRGGQGSLARGSTDIHNGADDNGSGTSALLEVARRLATQGKKLPRRIVFMAFSAEERGLIGSDFYVKNPVFPLDKTVAMLNMDMVGRLKDNKLIIQGADTATEFKPWVEDANKASAFTITHQTGGFGPSDHASFYGKKIPVMHFFTGLHADYHRPSDDTDKLDVVGMRRVADMVTYVANRVADNPARPTFQESAQPAPKQGSGGDRPYFGSIPDFGEATDGFAISGVTKGGPAEKGGLKSGDVILMLGENKIANLDDFDAALRKFKSGDKVVVTVRRGKEQLKLEVTLEAPR